MSQTPAPGATSCTTWSPGAREPRPDAPGRSSGRRAAAPEPRRVRLTLRSGHFFRLGPSIAVLERWAASSVPVLQIGKLWPLEGNELQTLWKGTLFASLPTCVHFFLAPQSSSAPLVLAVCQAQCLAPAGDQTSKSDRAGSCKERDTGMNADLPGAGAGTGSKFRLP